MHSVHPTIIIFFLQFLLLLILVMVAISSPKLLSIRVWWRPFIMWLTRDNNSLLSRMKIHGCCILITCIDIYADWFHSYYYRSSWWLGWNGCCKKGVYVLSRSIISQWFLYFFCISLWPFFHLKAIFDGLNAGFNYRTTSRTTNWIGQH